MKKIIDLEPLAPLIAEVIRHWMNEQPQTTRPASEHLTQPSDTKHKKRKK